ncbi:PAS domain-containing protein [Leptolyngbya sp. AN03gr2]|uniref:PAS domain-containing protein n=1 Tax=unclassified Leptolyngbya TaxID=2650499 RepID=UPI003D314AAA
MPEFFSELRDLCDSMPQFVWVSNAQGELQYVNRQWVDYSGLTVEQSQNPENIAATYHPDDVQAAFDQWAIALTAQQPCEIEGRLRASDGSYRWFLIRIVPVRDDQGRVLRWYGTSTDIHDRKVAQLNEQFLHELDQRLRQLDRAEAMLWEATRSVGNYLSVDRCAWHRVDLTKDLVMVEQDWARQTLPSAIGVYRLSDFILPELLELGCAGQSVVVSDVTTYPYTAPLAENYVAFGSRAFVTVPCIHEGCLIAVLNVNTETVRQWQPDEVALLQAIVARLWSLIEQTQMVQALRDSECRFRTLADNIAQLAWIADKTGWIFWYNQRWFDYTGTTLEAMQGWGWRSVHHPDHVDRVVERIRHCFETGEVWEDTFPLRRQDGQYRWFLSRAIPIRTEQGQVLRWFGTNTDITERRQAEAALQQSEDRYRMAVTSAKLGTWDWDLTTNELKWDASCKAMFGLPLEAESSIEQFFEGLHLEDRDRLTQIVQTALNPASGGFYDTEYRTIGIEDGIERWVAAKGQAYFSSTGQPVRFIGTVLDITEVKRYEAERQRAQRQLQDQQERLQAALFAAGTGTFRWDIRTNELDWDDNLDRLFGLPPGETARSLESFIQLVHPDDRQGVIDLCAHCASKGADFDMDFRVVYPDGSIHWLSDKGKTFFDEAGNPTYMTGACVDITERKQAEAELQRQTTELIQANRLKDEFLAALSHELRTPLNPILGWTKLLKGQKLTPTKTAEALDIVERNVKQQLALISDLLDMSSVIQGKLNLEFHPVDLTLMVNTAIETVQFAAQVKDIAIRVSYSFADPKSPEVTLLPVLGDRDRLQQILWNLLSNAIKFTPDNGRVEVDLSIVTSRSGNRYAQVQITDNGIGIAPDFLPYVFDRFRQADGSLTRRYGGLGLGLSIVRHLVELHGGTVTADSPGLEQGATFTVKLRLCSPVEAWGNERLLSSLNLHSTNSRSEGSVADSSSTQANPLLSATGALTGVRVLIVDDDQDNVDLLQFLLQQDGARVTAFTSPLDALESVAQNPPDLIISDIGMPKMTGHELIRAVRALPQGKQIPALALTAFARTEDETEAIQAGFQTHIAKPVDPHQLLAIVVQLLID